MEWFHICAIFYLLSSIQCAVIEKENCPRNGSIPSPFSSLGRNVRGIYKSAAIYGLQGDYFEDDISTIHTTKVTDTSVSFFSYIHSIQFTYATKDGSLYEADQHGNQGPSGFGMRVFDYQVLAEIVVTYGSSDYIDSLAFVVKNMETGEERTYGPVGNQGKYTESLRGIIVGLHGRLGTDGITGIGMYYLRFAAKGPKFGSDGGTPWDDPIQTHIPHITNIDRIELRFGESIDSIQVDYELLWGGVLEGDTHGSSGGVISTIDLEQGEKIIEVHAKVTTIINQLTFISEKPDGSRETYGPYGKAGAGESFYIIGDIIGFYGRAGDMLDSLGVYILED